jgi:cytochrome b561
MTDTYDRRTIALHWASAALVLGLWAVGQCIDFFPRGAPRMTVRSFHIAFGLLLALLLAARMAWRLRGGVSLPAADPGIQGRLAFGAHHLMYGLLCIAVIVGMACVWIRGDSLFNFFTVPSFDPTNRRLAHNAVELHGWIANVLLPLAAVHAAAAVWHHRVLKDGVMRRMWPGLQAPSVLRVIDA